MFVDFAVRDVRRKMKWKRWEWGLQQHCYIGSVPPFRIQGFFGNRSRDLRRCDFSDAINGPLPRLPRKPQPIALIYRCLQLLLAEISLTSPPFIEAQ